MSKRKNSKSYYAMDEFNNDLFLLSRAPLDVEPISDNADLSDELPSEIFTRIINGERNMDVTLRDSVLTRLMHCLSMKVGDNEEFKRKIADVDDKIADVEYELETQIKTTQTAIIASLNAMGVGYDEILDEPIYAEGADNAHLRSLVNERIEAGLNALAPKKRALIKNIDDLNYTKSLVENSMHKELSNLADERAVLIRKEILRVADANELDALDPEEEQCKIMIKAMNNRFEVRKPMEILVPLKDMNGSISQHAMLLAILYGYAKSGLTVTDYRSALNLRNAAERLIVPNDSKSSIGDEFINNEVSRTIEHINSIIRAGYDPLRWREAFGKPISGMVEKMLTDWVAGGYKTLTLAHLHDMFVPKVGSLTPISLYVAEDVKTDEKEDKVLAAFKDMLSYLGEKKTAAEVEADDENAT